MNENQPPDPAQVIRMAPGTYNLPPGAEYVNLLMAGTHLNGLQARTGMYLVTVGEALREIDAEMHELTRDAGERYMEAFRAKKARKEEAKL